MTHLRQIMLQELRRRNYAESTIHIYIHTVEHFGRYFHRPPNQLDCLLETSFGEHEEAIRVCFRGVIPHFIQEYWVDVK